VEERFLGFDDRKRQITALEKELDARVLSLVTGDRQGMETRIAPDILPLVAEHLASIGPSKRLALFLYTPGGDSIAGWGLVNLLREYCEHLLVVVPFRSLSCGTLVAIGADEIVLGKHGLLSPVDPSVNSPFNPQVQVPGAQPGIVNFLPVSVEDMVGFLDLARSEAGLKSEESLVEVIKLLANQVNPLALGAVYRAREQSSSLAKRLLSRHEKDIEKVERIVKRLTKELPTHSYLIGRQEAKEDLGLSITESSVSVEKIIWSIYQEYAAWLLFNQPASTELDLGAEAQKQVRYERAAVESLHDGSLKQHVFVTDKILLKIKMVPPGLQAPVDQVGERILYQGWLAQADGEASK
jgi:hypothetical protein